MAGEGRGAAKAGGRAGRKSQSPTSAAELRQRRQQQQEQGQQQQRRRRTSTGKAEGSAAAAAMPRAMTSEKLQACGRATAASELSARGCSAQATASLQAARSRLAGRKQETGPPALLPPPSSRPTANLHSAISALDAEAISRGATVCWNSCGTAEWEGMGGGEGRIAA